MPNAQIYITPFINAAFVKAEPLQAPIDRVEEQEMDGAVRLILYLSGVQKGLPLNVVNTNTLCDKLGDNTDDWIGATIELFCDRCQFRGKMTDCVRIRFPKPE